MMKVFLLIALFAAAAIATEVTAPPHFTKQRKQRRLLPPSSSPLLLLRLFLTVALSPSPVQVEDLGAPTPLEVSDTKEVGESAKEGTGG